MLNLLVFSLFVLPWFNPFAPGPSPTVMPLLFSWACVACLLGLRCWQQNVGARERFEGVIAAALLAAGLLSSAMGLLQYFGLSADLAPWVNQTAVGEAFANLRQRNQFATLTNIAMAALLWWAYRLQHSLHHFVAAAPSSMTAWQTSRVAWAAVLPLTWLAAALLTAGNAASSSRTGMLQLVALAAMVLFWGGWRRGAVRQVLVAAALGYALALVALPLLVGFDLGSQSMFARLRDGAPACSSRWLLWSNVLTLIAEKPWLGWGWGELDYAHFITRYAGPRFCEILDNAHNLPLHLAVELGLPATVAICGALSWMVWRARPWAETDPTRQMAWAVLAVIGLHSLLEYPLWYGPFQIAVGLCVMLLWRPKAVCKTSSPLKKQENLAVVQVFTALTAAILIACIVYAAWDYRRVSQIYLESSERDPSLRDNTLAKISDTKLFRNQFLFAQLGMTPLTASNAQWTYDTATQLLHYSPEPRVIEKVIESATLLGIDAEAVAHLARYKAAFPKESAQWLKARTSGA